LAVFCLPMLQREISLRRDGLPIARSVSTPSI